MELNQRVREFLARAGVSSLDSLTHDQQFRLADALHTTAPDLHRAVRGERLGGRSQARVANPPAEKRQAAMPVDPAHEQWAHDDEVWQAVLWVEERLRGIPRDGTRVERYERVTNEVQRWLAMDRDAPEPILSVKSREFLRTAHRVIDDAIDDHNKRRAGPLYDAYRSLARQAAAKIAASKMGP